MSRMNSRAMCTSMSVLRSMCAVLRFAVIHFGSLSRLSCLWYLLPHTPIFTLRTLTHACTTPSVEPYSSRLPPRYPIAEPYVRLFQGLYSSATWNIY